MEPIPLYWMHEPRFWKFGPSPEMGRNFCRRTIFVNGQNMLAWPFFVLGTRSTSSLWYAGPRMELSIVKRGWVCVRVYWPRSQALARNRGKEKKQEVQIKLIRAINKSIGTIKKSMRSRMDDAWMDEWMGWLYLTGQRALYKCRAEEKTPSQI